MMMEHLEINLMAPNFHPIILKSKNLTKISIFGLKTTTMILASLQFNFPTRVMPHKKII